MSHKAGPLLRRTAITWSWLSTYLARGTVERKRRAEDSKMALVGSEKVGYDVAASCDEKTCTIRFPDASCTVGTDVT